MSGGFKKWCFYGVSSKEGVLKAHVHVCLFKAACCVAESYAHLFID